MKKEKTAGRCGRRRLLWLLPPLLFAVCLLLLRLQAEPAGRARETPAEPTAELKIETDDELIEGALTLCREQGSAARGGIETKLSVLRERDPARSRAWEGIFDALFAAGTEPVPESGVPAGLPGDDSLCIVVFGYQLDADGSMAPELVGRCEAALACAVAYPKAGIVLTGGHTASSDAQASEARAMAAWLTERGVEPERLFLEEKSLSTVQNAVYVDRLLAEHCPSVDSLLIVSSSYHVPLCALLMEETAWLRVGEGEEKPYAVCGLRGFAAETSYDYRNLRTLTDTVRSTAVLRERVRASLKDAEPLPEGIDGTGGTQ